MLRDRKVPPMAAVCRPARLEDLQRADTLVVHSINDLTARHGFGPIASPRPPRFQQFCLEDDPDGLWVAEDEGQIAGFAFSWVCGDLWFLAQLFVSPGQQGSGLGNELLKRTLRQAEKRGSTNTALITFAFNRVSQGLYIRHGLFPRLPLYLFSASRDGLRGRLGGAQFRCEPLDKSAAHARNLNEIDAQALGTSREKHHGFLIDEDGTRGFAFYDGDKCVGYAYIAASGHIGPLAVVRPEAMGAAFRTALNIAGDGGAPNVSAFLPGTSEAALTLAMEYGMRIAIPMLVMSARPFGDWGLYLPRNPGFM
jgi:ribosomal protein S18 acetylase RimI-like enzyme